jgi:hypothetical protein
MTSALVISNKKITTTVITIRIRFIRLSFFGLCSQKNNRLRVPAPENQGEHPTGAKPCQKNTTIVLKYNKC